MEQEALLLRPFEAVDVLLVLACAERRDDKRLSLATREQRRAVRARQNVDFRKDRTNRFQIAAVDAHLRFQNVAAHLLERTREPAADQIYTLHAELEGMRLASQFEQLLLGWKAQGWTIGPVRASYEGVEPMALPRCTTGPGTVPGRSGTLLVQGEEFLADVDLAQGSTFLPGPPHDAFDALRAAGGIAWHEEPPVAGMLGDNPMLQFVDSLSPVLGGPLQLAMHDRSALTVVVHSGRRGHEKVPEQTPMETEGQS